MGQTTPPPPQVVVVRQGHSGCFWFLIFLLIAVVIVGIVIFLSVMGILGACLDRPTTLPGRTAARGLSSRASKARVWRQLYGNASSSDRLSVLDYYGGPTTSLPLGRPLIRTTYIRTTLAEPSLDKIKTRLDSLTPR
jgi:hypothetical protein